MYNKYYKKVLGRMLFFDFTGCQRHNTVEATKKAAEAHWEAKLNNRYTNIVGRRRMYESPEALKRAIDAYFRSCEGVLHNKYGIPINDENGDPRMVVIRPYTISGLANAVGINTDVLRRYHIWGAENRIPPEFAIIVEEAKQKVQQYAEEALYDMGSQRGAQFIMQAGFKWSTPKEEAEIRATNARVSIAREELEIKKSLLGEGNDDSEMTINIVQKSKVEE